MKKLLLTLAMVMAVMLVVQPTYAATGETFNITVTITSFSMKLMKSDGLAHYNGWDISAPPGGCLTMTAMDAIMVSLTGVLDKDMDIFTHVETSGAWNSVMPNPGTPLNNDEFILLADHMIQPPIDNGNPLVMAQPKPITDATDAPLCTIPQGSDKAWLIYSFRAAPDYTVHNETIAIKVEAMPVP
ncbi:secreted protein [Candidatus Magnetomorum sp. HK-1]|nr:secreted protein [Candidatus Magnetomorum sp. HK-1]